MSSSGFTSSDLAKGRKFLNQLLYVQHVDKEKDTASEIPEQSLEEHLLTSRQMFADLNFTPYLKNPKANIDILKSFLTDTIILAKVYSNPLPIPLASKSNVTIHAFVVLRTWNDSDSKKRMWWSLEKNGKYIVLQQSPRKNDVTQKIYDVEKKEHVQRLGPVKELQSAIGNAMDIRNLLQAIWKTNQLSSPYHLLLSNCQNFASFVFAKSNYEGKKWSTVTSAIVDRFGLKNKKIQQPGIEADAVKYKSIVNDEKFKLYCAMIEERVNDFEELSNDWTRETLNSVDSQGYTLLEWATAFSTSDWPIDEKLMKKGAEIPSDEEGLNIFRRNVFFIGLQYLPPDKNLLSFDGIDINGVNKTSDTALHLALYGEKWEMAETILNQFENYDVNTTNSWGDTPLHLAAKLKCAIGLFKKIVEQASPENINQADKYGCTALHWVVIANSTEKMKLLLDGGIDINAQDKEGNTALHTAFNVELNTKIIVKLLKHVKRIDNKLVEAADVNIQNKRKFTALHCASMWPNIAVDLFKIIVNKSTDVNAQIQNGNTALHLAILSKSKIAVKELLKHKNVDAHVKNKSDRTALHCASVWPNIPADLFKKILDKSEINAKSNEGLTAFYYAILGHSSTAVKQLLQHKDVDVNFKNSNNSTAIHQVSRYWRKIHVDVFKIILEKSKDINAKDNDGNTALHIAISKKLKMKVKELLKHKNVDVDVKDKSEKTALHMAFSWPDIPFDLFKLILNKSADINAKDKDGDTALHLALLNKSKTTLKELLNHKNVDVDVKDKNNSTALHLATRWKKIPMDSFKIILNKSAEINAKDKYGNTALHYAIVKKSKTKIKNLLTREDVDVNVRSDNTLTALHLASRWRTFPIDLFKLIIKEKSADINAKNEDGDTALHLAIKRKLKMKVKELLEHNDVDVNVKDKSEKTALHIAVSWPNIPIDLFKLILAKSTEINAQDVNGDTALHIALSKKSKTKVKELLERENVDVNVKGNENLTPLHLASRWKRIPIQLFKIILDKSNDINAKDQHGSTSLHLAIMKESETAVKELLEDDRVDVNVKDNDNQTALYLASRWRFIPNKLFEKIKEKSTDINAKDDNGDTALHMAINRKSINKVRILLTFKDVDVNVKNKNNVTPIYCAFLWSNIPNDLFEMILKKSADNINGQNQDD